MDRWWHVPSYQAAYCCSCLEIVVVGVGRSLVDDDDDDDDDEEEER